MVSFVLRMRVNTVNARIVGFGIMRSDDELTSSDVERKSGRGIKELIERMN